LDDPSSWLPVNLGGGLEHFTSRVFAQFNMSGPNVSSSAACATSLLAIHLAVRDLRLGDCDLALAGGATVTTPHWPGYLQVEGGPVSTSGTIRPFDKDADGTVFGNGGGVAVLKRLADALADGDTIHAIIKGTGIFNDGGGKGSLAALGFEGQVEAISRALKDSGLNADTIGFVESHGTGTLLGDPMEVDAVSQVFRRDSDRKQFCALGALKANIGHAAAGAGILAFIKTCCALEHGKIPPNINFSTPNPLLKLSSTPFYIPTETVVCESKAHPRRAGVSSFGFGGNNAHIVLEAGPEPSPVPPSKTDREMIVLSARS
jgi:acyl transferase domain-containing protein